MCVNCYDIPPAYHVSALKSGVRIAEGREGDEVEKIITAYDEPDLYPEACKLLSEVSALRRLEDLDWLLTGHRLYGTAQDLFRMSKYKGETK